MRLHTSNKQTAKLIELGFEKPKSIGGYKPTFRVEYEGVEVSKVIIGENKQEPIYAYSIGELVEMLPEAICPSNDEDAHYFLSIETDSCLWKVFYEDECEDVLCSTFGVNLIDALYDMVTMLKEEGVI